MSSHLDQILHKLGWQDGFQIPVANAENQALEEEVARLTLTKVRAKTSCESSSAKLDNLQDHLKYVQQEQLENQKLLTAYAQQLQSEETKFKLSVAETEKIEQEKRKFRKETAEIDERQQLKRDQLQKAVVKVEKLKSETNWDAEALKAWEESLKKRDQDNEMIKNFSKVDQRRYNELEAKRQNLEVEFATRKHTVAKMVCDLTNYERILERTGKVLEEQATERDALIKQWKDSVKILHQRDEEIDKLHGQMVESQELVDKTLEKLEEQNQFHLNEIANNQQMELESDQLSAFNSRLRRDLNSMFQDFLLLCSEADALRRMVTTIANQLEKERSESGYLGQRIERREREIDKYHKKLDQLKRKAEEIDKSATTAAERATHFEKLIQYEEKLHKALINDSETMQAALFKALQEAQEQESVAKIKEHEVSGIVSTIKHLRKRNKDEKRNVERQREVVYELDYKIGELQNQTMNLEKVSVSEDRIELDAKCRDLEARAAEFLEIKNMLTAQVNKIRDDMRRLTTALAADQLQLSALKNKLQGQLLEIEGGQKQLQASKLHFQERQVEENVLRLRVDQLEKSTKKEEKTIYTLKKFRLNLEQALMERLLEINANKDVLSVKRRNLSEDRGRLKADLGEREIRREQFMKKYESILMTLGRGEDGQPLSVTHFKLKNAQEKMMLQQEGDELDGKIKKAEREIVAMENTLKVVNVTNFAFKRSLAPVEEDGLEIDEMKELEAQLLKVNDDLRQHRRQLATKRHELAEVKAALEVAVAENKTQQEFLESLENEYGNTVEVSRDKEEKVKRTERCLVMIKKKVSATEMEKFDRDFEIRQLRDANRSAMQRLAEMSFRYQEMAPLVARYTSEYGISLPEKGALSSSSSSLSSISCRSEKEQGTARTLKSQSSVKSANVAKVVLTLNI